MVVSGRFVSDVRGRGTKPEKGNAPETINQMEVNHEP
jgi:hypothetical protein